MRTRFSGSLRQFRCLEGYAVAFPGVSRRPRSISTTSDVSSLRRMPPGEAASSPGWAWTVVSVSGFPAVPTVCRGRRMEHGSRAGIGVVLGMIREASLAEGPQVYAALPACLPACRPPPSSQLRGSGVRAAMLCSSRFSFHSRGCGTANPCSERSRPMTHGLTLDDSARLAGRTATRVAPAYRAAETLGRDDSRSSIPDIVRAAGGSARRVHSSEAHPTLPSIPR